MAQAEPNHTWITDDIFVKSIKIENLKAWEPWRLVQSILFTLQNSDIDEEHPEWRLYWFAGVALLRTIGHVLKKVDSLNGEAHKIAINESWQNWKENRDLHSIFFEFIEEERNNILKEFSFGAELPEEDDSRLLVFSGTNLDAHQLFREAVYWWRIQLEFLEDRIQDFEVV